MKYIILTSLILNLISCHSADKETNPQSIIPEIQSETSKPKVEPTWAESMRKLKDSLQTIQPLIFDSKQFANPKNQKILQVTIRAMARQSKDVSHNPTLISRDPTVRFVASQFSEDLQLTDEAFTSGKRDFARYRLLKVTSYCVECHTRTQQGPKFNLGRVDSFLGKMTAVSQIEFLIATRRYDTAFDVAIDTLRSNRRGSPLAWEIEKVARLGLQIAVQFKEDIKSAEKLIATIESNPDSPTYLKEAMSPWKSSLVYWKNNSLEFSDLTGARTLIKNRKSEVDDMRAISGLLHILSNYPKGDELAEALYLTGQSYETLNIVSPMSLNENYYESCIRQVPHSAWAKKCFQKLEASVAFGYSGSSGLHVPMGVQIYLNILKKEAE